MIKYTEIEAALGVKTLMTREQQAAIENWYRVAIDGEPCNGDPDTKPMGLPAAICAELARLTTLELEAKVEGSPRADWINRKLQRAISPRRRRILAVALALGSGVWKPYQAGNDIGVSFTNATAIYPISTTAEGQLAEAVFVNRIREDDNYYHRLEWMHLLRGPEDYHGTELALLDEFGVSAITKYPCVQVINLAFRSSSPDSLGSRTNLEARTEWAEVEPVAYLPGLEALPCGYFVTPIVNTVDPDSEMGAAMFSPAIPQIIDADVQFTRLDWEYEGGELAVDVDDQYLAPTDATGQHMTNEESLRKYGVPLAALNKQAPQHKDRLYRGLNVETGIADGSTFYQVFSPSLRDGSYLTGLNQYLRQVEQKAGLSYGVLSQVSEVERTATEIISSKQKLYATVSDLQAALEEALRELITALDFWADQVDSAPPRGKINVSFHWDDSIILDRLTEMSQWQAELQLGLRSKVEYRQHFYGEDEATAQAAVAAITQENMAADILQGVLNNGNQNTRKNQAGKRSTAP